MKLLLASLVLLSTAANAITAPVLKGNVNLDAITTDFAKSIGIKGLLPVSIETEVTTASLKFKGYNKVETCLEYGEEEIPSHPETAPCLKTETSWIPEITLTAATVSSVLNVGDKKIDSKISTTFTVPSSCISNLKEETVVGEVAPMEAPAVLKLNAYCSTYSYTRIESKNVKPSALKGKSMEAIVDLTVYALFTGESLELNKSEALKVNLSDVKSVVGSMWDFGGYNTRIFRYYDRVIFQ